MLRLNGLVALSHPRFPVFPWGQLLVDDNGQRIGACVILEALSFKTEKRVQLSKFGAQDK